MITSRLYKLVLVGTAGPAAPIVAGHSSESRERLQRPKPLGQKDGSLIGSN